MTLTVAFFTYIVRCCDGSFYIGQTNNLQRRLLQHNGLKSGGAYYTKFKRPVELVYFETYPTLTLAMRREHELKKLTHKQKGKMCKDFKIHP